MSSPQETSLDPEQMLALGILPAEPAFRRPLSSNLGYAKPERDNPLGRYLAAIVARSPHNLLVHVQRVHCHLQAGQSEQLFGALVDLFIALGAHGQALKLRLLDYANNYLTGPQLSFLFEHLDQGLSAYMPIEGAHWSCLSAGVQGDLQLVQRAQRQVSDLSPLLLARELIDCGELDNARELLETALMQQPQDLELQRELLEIYRYTHDAASLERMADQLQACAVELDPQWTQVRAAIQTA